VGVQLRDIITGEEKEVEAFSGKRIAIDAFNALYQFITIIRQKDGTPLMDSKGRITSHLSGLLYRTARLVEAGIKPCYVFDGEPPEFKLVKKERSERKEEAEERLREAMEEGDVEKVRLYAQQAAKLEDYMVEDAKQLLSFLGIPWVQAPSEGEAQAAFMAMRGDVWAVGSQDYDSLLFGSPILVRNLTITGRRKLPRKDVYIEIKPEQVQLESNLKALGISREQLILIGLLVGTDYNPGGIKGIGPKKALELVREKKTLEGVLRAVEWNPEWPPPDEIFNFFLNPPHTESYTLEWREPDLEKVLKFMVDEHDFSEERVEKAVGMIRQGMKRGAQASLSEWF